MKNKQFIVIYNPETKVIFQELRGVDVTVFCPNIYEMAEFSTASKLDYFILENELTQPSTEPNDIIPIEAN